MSLFGCFRKPKKVPKKVHTTKLTQVCTAAPVKETVATHESNTSRYEEEIAKYENWRVLFLHAEKIEASNALAKEEERLRILSDPTSLASQFRPNQPGTEHGPGTRAHIAWMQAKGLCDSYPD